jgi:CheY-like chemotaxis protein
MLRRLIGEDVQIVTDLAANLPRVKIDPVQLEQLLINLAVNARDAMPRGGLLAIATASVHQSNGSLADTGEVAAGHYVQLTVSDTGEGMSDSVKMQIFEPFFTTKGPGKGTGLGLSTVYGIVSQAGGAVSVESEIGKGTSFQILFPAVGEPAAANNMTTLHAATQGKETILIAEDDAGVRQLSRLALEMQGYTVIEAGSGEAAMRAAASHSGPIHLLVTDVVMPGGGGRLLADMIRSTRPGVTVLYVSGYMDDAIVRHGIEDSTDAFLQKPFTPASLARKVRDVIDAAPGF